jgi:hypothetical protein
MLLELKNNLKLILNQFFHAFGAKNQFKIDLKSIFPCFCNQKSIQN